MTGNEIAGAFGVFALGFILLRRIMARHRTITINGPVGGDIVGRDKITEKGRNDG